MENSSSYKIQLGLVQEGDHETVREAFQKSTKQFRMVPNLYKAMANAPALLRTYMEGYSHFAVESGFTPQEREVIYLIISYENGCDYCMAAHSTVAEFQAKLDPQIIQAIRSDSTLQDPKLQVLSQFVREMLLSRGRPSKESTKRFLNVGYSEKQVLDIILAISLKTMSNYTNHLFVTPIDPVFKAREFKVVQFASRVFRSFSKA